MAGKRKRADQSRVSNTSFRGQFAFPLFNEADVVAIAKIAQLPPPPDRDRHWLFAIDLTNAFIAAHVTSQMEIWPGAGQLKKSFSGAAAAASQLLLALGVEVEPYELIQSPYSSVLGHSAIARALLTYVPTTSIEKLPRDVLEMLGHKTSQLRPAERSSAALRRQLVEAVRGAAFLVVAAQLASSTLPNSGPRGPAHDPFAGELLERLARCYFEMFGPACFDGIVDGNKVQRDAATKWLRETLVVAQQRAEATRYVGTSGETVVQTAHDEMVAGIKKLHDMSIQTLTTKFFKAMARRSVPPTETGTVTESPQ